MDNGESSYRRYLDGDEEALEAIVKEYFDSLVFFLCRYVGDPETAEDIAIDVFTYVVVHPKRYNFRVSLKTYLFMLGKSRALDCLRRRKRRGETDLSQAMHLPSDAPTPEELVLTDRRKQAVNAALSQLEPEQRLALHLTYFEELSCAEAAKVMGKNTKQVYNLLYRGKNALRTILEKEGELL